MTPKQPSKGADPRERARDRFELAFERRQSSLEPEPSWLTERRARGIARFAELGLPARKNEAWKYTDVEPLARVPFELVRPDDSSPLAADPPERDGVTLLFSDGCFQALRNPKPNLPAGLNVMSLRSALRDRPDELGEYFDRYARVDQEPFTALNSALFHDGAFISVDAGALIEETIHLVFATSDAHRPLMSHPRSLILAGRGSALTVVEHYVGPGGERADRGPALINTVTEAIVGPGAALTYHCDQRQDAQDFHVGTLEVHAARDASFDGHGLSVGATMARQAINVNLADEGASCRLHGLYLGRGRQRIDHHITVEHAHHHCTSRQLYKGILDEGAHGVFTGRIHVAKDAQKSSAEQASHSLLLADGARANTRPQLEIYADDVRCAHGATVGQLDSEAEFYLRSRGLSRDQARDMLAYGFANEVAGSIRDERLRAELLSTVMSWLPGQTLDATTAQ